MYTASICGSLRTFGRYTTMITMMPFPDKYNAMPSYPIYAPVRIRVLYVLSPSPATPIGIRTVWRRSIPRQSIVNHVPTRDPPSHVSFDDCSRGLRISIISVTPTPYSDIQDTRTSPLGTPCTRRADYRGPVDFYVMRIRSELKYIVKHAVNSKWTRICLLNKKSMNQKSKNNFQ